MTNADAAASLSYIAETIRIDADLIVEGDIRTLEGLASMFAALPIGALPLDPDTADDDNMYGVVQGVLKAAVRMYREGTGQSVGDFNDAVRNYLDSLRTTPPMCANCDGSGASGTNHSNVWPCEYCTSTSPVRDTGEGKTPLPWMPKWLARRIYDYRVVVNMRVGHSRGDMDDVAAIVLLADTIDIYEKASVRSADTVQQVLADLRNENSRLVEALAQKEQEARDWLMHATGLSNDVTRLSETIAQLERELEDAFQAGWTDGNLTDFDSERERASDWKNYLGTISHD